MNYRIYLQKLLKKIFFCYFKVILNTKVQKFCSFFTVVLLFGYIYINDEHDLEYLCKSVSYYDIIHADQENPNLIEFIRENVITYPGPTRYNLDKPYFKDDSEYSQGFLYEDFFKRKKRGTFIEAGAWDGEKYSNTLLLELAHKWVGLLVEPNPVNYNKVVQKGRKVYTAECCLSPTKNHSKFQISVDEQFSHLNIVDTEESNKRDDEMKVKFVDVDCFPLYSLMVATNLTTLDLLVLDLEGVEMRVLHTLPWEKVNISLISIEHQHVSEGKEHLKNFMATKNYKLLEEDKFYSFFVNKNIADI